MEIKEFATALLVLHALGVDDEIEKRFSEEDRELLFSWFIDDWNVEDDDKLIEENMQILHRKLKELKGDV